VKKLIEQLNRLLATIPMQLNLAEANECLVEVKQFKASHDGFELPPHQVNGRDTQLKKLIERAKKQQATKNVKNQALELKRLARTLFHDALDSERNATLALEAADAFKHVSLDPEAPSPSKQTKDGSAHHTKAKEKLQTKKTKREQLKALRDEVERTADDLLKGRKEFDDEAVKRLSKEVGMKEEEDEVDGNDTQS